MLFSRRDFYGLPTATIVDASGGSEVKVKRNLDAVTAAWSPDGEQILFSNGDIWRYKLAVGTLKRLTSTKAYESGPDWQAR